MVLFIIIFFAIMLFCGVAVFIISAEDDEEALLKKYKHNKYNKKLNKYT